MAEAVKRMKEARREMPIEVEAQSLADVDAALTAGADVILLDNLSIEEIREAVRKIGRRTQVEISGGVTLERIPELARTGANYVSIGALTHSAPAADLSWSWSRMFEPLPAEIRAALRATADRRGTFGEPTYFFSETQSTNDVAATLADRGAPEGATVVARRRRPAGDVSAAAGSHRRVRDSTSRSCSAIRAPSRC